MILDAKHLTILLSKVELPGNNICTIIEGCNQS